MSLINLAQVLVKSTTACTYRGNEILGASGDFGELGFVFFFQISYFCLPRFTTLRKERRFSADWVRSVL